MSARNQVARGFRSTGWLSLLLWGLALPGSPALAHASPASAGDASEIRGTGQRPVLLPLRSTRPAETMLRVQDLWQRRLQAESQVRQRLGPHGVSRKAREWRPDPGKQAAGERVLRVLLIRIAFETDESGSLTSVTQDGNFVLEPDDTAIFDPPPHDKAYFEAHLRGLGEYWSSMSDGRLQIESRVLPDGDQDAYRLRDIADYGPGYGNFWTLDGLVSLVRDMIVAADRGTAADGSVNLADYDFDDPDTYIIFAHAGGDLQSNLVFEPGQEGYSPNDIPTFFVLLGDDDQVPIESVDPDTNESGLVRECSVIPESTSQDGLLGSIAAALYHEFGHALGLPDLYDTFTGLPGVGYWDLMDTGTNVVASPLVDVATRAQCEASDCDWLGGDTVDPADDFCVCSVVGLMPPSISMWCKWYLGWVEPTVIGGRTQPAILFPTHLQDREEKAALVDFGSDEFFLVEHRWIAPTSEGLFLRRDPATGVVLYLARDDGTEEPPNSHNYDFFLPWPGGALVWHVRQDRINEAIDFNLVQIDPQRRGLELVEADGIQDIGVFEFTTVGFVGSETDAFREETVIQVGEGQSIVYPRTATEITPTTLPSTQSGFRVPSGASLRDFPPVVPDENQPIVIEGDIAGLVDVDSPAETIFPVSLPFVASGENLVPVGGDAQSLGWFEFDAGGAIVFAARPSDESAPWGLYAYSLLALPRFFGQERIAEFTAPLAGPLIWADGLADGADRPALVAATADGRVRAFLPDGVPSRGEFAAERWPDASLGGAIDTPAIFVRNSSGRYVVAASRADGSIYVLDETGQAHPEFTAAFGIEGLPLQTGVRAADFDGDGAPDELVFAAGGQLYAAEVDGTTLSGFPVRLPASFAPGPDETAHLLAWPGAAGQPDRVVMIAPQERGAATVLLARDGDLWSARMWGRPFDGPLVAEPALGDLEGDGRLELLVSTGQRLWVRNEAGVDVTGFPVLLADQHLHGLSSDGPGSLPLVADVDADRVNEVMVLSAAGLVYAFEFDGQLAEGYPRRYSGTRTGAPMLLDYDDGAGTSRALVLFEAKGDTLRPGRRAQSARLTAADLGPASGLAAPQRPAEWLGRGGGPRRTYRGTEGGVVGPVPGPARLAQGTPATVAPNPVRYESEATARFFSATRQTARLTVYTLEGEEILRREQDNEGGVMGEVRWDPRSLVPGAYVCRLEYVGAGGPTTDLMPLYVER